MPAAAEQFRDNDLVRVTLTSVHFDSELKALDVNFNSAMIENNYEQYNNCNN